MSNAARVTDAHVCPAMSPSPHVGGVVQGPGVSTVLLGYQPAATQGTPCACAAPVPNAIASGSGTVTIGYKPAARAGDSTTHGGVVIGGCPTVLIGG